MKSNHRNILIVFLVFFSIIGIIPSVLGKTRRVYLTDYIYSNEIEGQGFENGISTIDEVSIEATAYALDILKSLGRSAHDIEDLQTKLEDDINFMFNNDAVNLYNLYFLLKSLFTIHTEYSVEDSLKNRIFQYLNDTEQIGGGFSFLNISMTPTLSSTFFVVQIHSMLAPAKVIQNVTLHKDWILLNNNTDGGYGNSTSTVITTYYAVSLLDTLTSVNDLVNKNQTLSYLQSFYVGNPSDINKVGGFLPDLNSNSPILSSTFYCVMAISAIDGTLLNNDQTANWILSRQYFQDGGFIDITEGNTQQSSSVIGSYFAAKTLATLDLLGKLAVDVWMVEFNYLILILIVGSIGILAVIGIVIWRRRRI
ncbi:MAG: prenyltransferase/squalene oxidase repeat-containing protein [Promethearchaeota archaeon]